MSTFKIIADALHSGKLDKIELPTESVDHRRLTVDEIKEHIIEEAKKAKTKKDMKMDNKHLGDAEIASQIEWIKSLDLKEAVETGVVEASEDNVPNVFKILDNRVKQNVMTKLSRLQSSPDDKFAFNDLINEFLDDINILIRDKPEYADLLKQIESLYI